MKKAIIVATALGFLSAPAFAGSFETRAPGAMSQIEQGGSVEDYTAAKKAKKAKKTVKKAPKKAAKRA